VSPRFPQPALLEDDRPLLHESVVSDGHPSPISSGLLNIVRDVASLNVELERALEENNWKRVKATLDHGANPNHLHRNKRETMLMTACYNHDEDSLIHLLQAGADPNGIIATHQSGDQITPLMIAAENGLTRGVSELLRHNANPHVRNANGETALLAAARTNHHDAFAVLVGSMVSSPP
jgi:ankyrin repeat protein